MLNGGPFCSLRKDLQGGQGQATPALVLFWLPEQIMVLQGRLGPELSLIGDLLPLSRASFFRLVLISRWRGMEQGTPSLLTISDLLTKNGGTFMTCWHRWLGLSLRELLPREHLIPVRLCVL